MGDHTRNRYSGWRAELSAIFKLFRTDFAQGHLELRSLEDLLLRHADQLALSAADRRQIRPGHQDIRFLDYDWSLNDSAR